ncbi:MAG: SLBB domain-containing protein [Magnetovibrionaceae bacterium]
MKPQSPFGLLMTAGYFFSLAAFLVTMIFAVVALSTSVKAETVTLGIGDILIIALPGEAAFEEPFAIDRDGTVMIPEVGTVALAGKSIPEARIAIEAALSDVYRDLDRLQVALKERRLPVNVLGYVNTPGPVDLPVGATVQMALNAAGGLAQGAQLDRLQVRRGGQVTTFDFKHYLDTGNDADVPKLQALDTVFVPASPLTGNVQVEFDARTLTAAGDAAEDGSAITVFGEVHRPGVFAWKGEGTVIDFLMRAGGVTRYAGIEQIRVISEGEPHPFNMREYLDTGLADNLPPLAAGDTIFVPQATEQVKVGARVVYVMGEVFKPGAYETKEGAEFFDILANAGGPTRFAETRQIRILKADGAVQPFDLQGYTEGTNDLPLPQIEPGDAVLVPEKTDMNEKSWLKVAPNRAVRIMGAVNRPGRYEWSDEMNLLDLMAHAGGPMAAADTAHIQVLKGDDDSATPALFDFKAYLETGGAGTDVPVIAAGDTVVVPELPKDPNNNKSQWVRQASDRSIYIMGAVGAPGRFAFNSDLNFLDILAAADGPTGTADLRNIRISHRGGDTMEVTKLNLSLYFETGDESLLPEVKPEDVIFIPTRQRDWLDKPKELTVRVLGEVARPGRYKFDDSMTILDLLAEAGGPTRSAYQERIVVVNAAGDESRARSFDLVHFAKTGAFEDLPVIRAGDTVYVPNEGQSPYSILSAALRDAVSVLSLVRLATSFGG